MAFIPKRIDHLAHLNPITRAATGNKPLLLIKLANKRIACTNLRDPTFYVDRLRQDTTRFLREILSAMRDKDSLRIKWFFSKLVLNDILPYLENKNPPNKIFVEYFCRQPSQIIQITCELM